jgi:hypothetical protein
MMSEEKEQEKYQSLERDSKQVEGVNYIIVLSVA